MPSAWPVQVMSAPGYSRLDMGCPVTLAADPFTSVLT